MRGLLQVILLFAVLLAGLAVAAYFVNREPEAPSNGPPVTKYKQFEQTAAGKPICPKCGRTSDVRQYQYGLTREAPPEGMISGGCAVGPDSPEYKCLRCGTNFGESSFYKKLHEPNKTDEGDELKKQEKKP